MRKLAISYIYLCADFAFNLNPLHCDAYLRDGVVKFQTRHYQTEAAECPNMFKPDRKTTIFISRPYNLTNLRRVNGLEYLTHLHTELQAVIFSFCFGQKLQMY